MVQLWEGNSGQSWGERKEGRRIHIKTFGGKNKTYTAILVLLG